MVTFLSFVRTNLKMSFALMLKKLMNLWNAFLPELSPPLLIIIIDYDTNFLFRISPSCGGKVEARMYLGPPPN